jgi:hypothetical protein
VHPPPFRPNHRLSDWPDCHLEMHCSGCNGRTVITPIKLLIAHHGNVQFADLLPKLRCSKCQNRPAPVFLCASPMRKGGHGGPKPDWALELVPDGGLL